MPWTFAHPAAVLPLRALAGRRLPFAALVIGSLTPDLGYYCSAFAFATFAHSTSGLLACCLPSGALLLMLFLALRPALVALLPEPHRSRCRAIPGIERRHVPRSAWLRTALGLLAGAATHVLWDGFTHRSADLVARLPLLQSSWFAGPDWPLYRLLQQASTALGVLVLALWYRRWLRTAHCPPDAKCDPRAERTRWSILLACVVAAAGTTALSCHLSGRWNPFHLILLATDSLLLWLLVAAAIRWPHSESGQ